MGLREVGACLARDTRVTCIPSRGFGRESYLLLNVTSEYAKDLSSSGATTGTSISSLSKTDHFLDTSSLLLLFQD